MKLTIGHLYPDLLNLYGDRGNVECMRKRLLWRGYEVEVREYQIEDSIPFHELDIILLGGGSDREQALVCERLRSIKDEFKEYVEDNGVVIAICGGYQLLGDYYQTNDGMIEGLGLLKIETIQKEGRLIGNIAIRNPLFSMPIVGFENHGGRTLIHDYQPFGTVDFGYGNEENSAAEGVMYKNVIGTYLHGPLLPKNPQVCDYLLTKAIERREKKAVTLVPLDDKEEIEANEAAYAMGKNKNNK